jgi:hypothetical protein
VKFFDFVLIVLFILGCFFGTLWAKRYLSARLSDGVAVAFRDLPASVQQRVISGDSNNGRPAPAVR